ncbi:MULTISPECIES: hypothetical protein [Mycolicibacterium]|jgi:hypothetical protein|uniref:Uncharacterized protein n=2 Tax=Mycolicibacterium TaxID=1866885 RepID=A1TEB4_MYCVP|nr:MULTISPECIES: hypothetical protein [Mycolicibacterium]ABM15514.1 hypothetical protein Mvan_4740 [Mycolicibacterium vanbaalenii PYR-1]MCV7130756.1 hypothetical protein [Mycolicibacterium vanbaalenii PYR-1]PQP40505.1 hypothetical protein C6A88_30845 [Mycolicibacterium austroafricanum]QZY45100.1 hypothetical protein K5L12_23215 [Mycolicibacterium austroafricanum]UJL28849.1 hypothetical protein HZU38_29370 [Mycolicibacterium vanbaalenii]
MNGAMLRRAAAGAVLSGVGAVATLGLGVFGYAIGVAQADIRCDPVCHGTWCPGEPVLWQIRYLAETWDPNVCHEYHQISGTENGGYAEGPLPPGTFVCPPFAFMCP